MGKHSAPSESHLGPALAVIAMASAPALLGGGTAQAATANSSVLNAIASCESGGKNVRNSTGSSTASGYWQRGTRSSTRRCSCSKPTSDIATQTITSTRSETGQTNSSTQAFDVSTESHQEADCATDSVCCSRSCPELSDQERRYPVEHCKGQPLDSEAPCWTQS
jgi:hypothetical protein